MSAPLTGQVTVTSTATQIAPASTGQVTAFTIKSSQTNTTTVYIGPAGVTPSTGYDLDAGETFEYERSTLQGQNKYELRPSDFYVVGAGGGTISWLASP